MVNAISIALSGLQAASKKVNAVASNIANVQTVGSLEPGGKAPYTPIDTQQTAIADNNGNSQGVQSDYRPRSNPYSAAYSPDSPFANKDGLVGAPNVDLAEEAINLTLAKTAYKANIKVIEAAKELDEELFRVFDKKI